MAEIGLISDTHRPARCPELPQTVFAALAGVDLLLHAGDVGAAWVLEELAAVAPVVAVHGNDDSAWAQAALPFQQVIVAGGRRVLLTHGHEPDRALEMAHRRDDDWDVKLDRWAARGRAVGADVVVSGHTHVPIVREQGGVWLVNPGAVASPNHATRQVRRTVARLTLRPDAAPAVRHLDLDAGGAVWEPAVEWAAGFAAAHARMTAPICDPALVADLARLWREAAPLAPDAWEAALARAAGPCWLGRAATYGHADIGAALRAAPDLSSAEAERLVAVVVAGVADG